VLSSELVLVEECIVRCKPTANRMFAIASLFFLCYLHFGSLTLPPNVFAPRPSEKEAARKYSPSVTKYSKLNPIPKLEVRI